ncbi:MAG TPA: hypothetical protein PK314_09140 [Deltaproteobacteria bacterium]|jgi:tetratricopeptide (TPR) repeat protein|nr:hypothetical protein [Deltaproteobacteria bacterium]HON62024.1 hypothetical protein [Deltaproteobacteria bacterium]HOS28012.1 hypothetical protein [Deltaproteobacteria bacterium]HPL88202.1 hypothetical protein [Deltaproteobacteria bacterium]
MMKALNMRFLFLALILAFCLQSCAGMNGPASPKSPVQPPAPAKPVPLPEPVDQTPAQSVNQARIHAAAGEYLKAITVYHDVHQKNPKDEHLAREYATFLNGAKSTAAEMLGKGEIAAAGALLYALKNSYPKFRGIEQMLSFDYAFLNSRLDYCRKTLTRQGFEEYRKGNLNQAIVLWQGLLAIDPGNEEMKEAVRTAIQQQKNLKEKN